jgi:hypothetical protein
LPNSVELTKATTSTAPTTTAPASTGEQFRLAVIHSPSKPEWDTARHVIQYIAYYITNECPQTRVRQYEWWALAHNAMHLSDWTTLFPKTNIEMMTLTQQEFLETLTYYQADGNKVFELGVCPEEIIEDEDEHTPEDEHSQDDNDSQEDEHTPEDEYSSTELQQLQESLNRQHAEISSLKNELKNELREMHELLRNFVMRSTTIDEGQDEVKRVINSKKIDKHKRTSFQKVTVLTNGGTEAQEPAVCTARSRLQLALHARRDPFRDKIREVGRGLSLADTQTGRYGRLYSRRRLCARRGADTQLLLRSFSNC